MGVVFTYEKKREKKAKERGSMREGQKSVEGNARVYKGIKVKAKGGRRK